MSKNQTLSYFFYYFICLKMNMDMELALIKHGHVFNFLLFYLPQNERGLGIRACTRIPIFQVSV